MKSPNDLDNMESKDTVAEEGMDTAGGGLHPERDENNPMRMVACCRTILESRTFQTIRSINMFHFAYFTRIRWDDLLSVSPIFDYITDGSMYRPL